MSRSFDAARWFVVGVLVLNGCATSKESLFGDTSHLPDMAAVYHRHSAAVSGASAKPTGRRYDIAATDSYLQLVGYTRDALTELDQRFPKLPNPTLLMYVDPHLTTEGLPVPGYATAFALFERVEYALPGEVPPVASPPYPVRPRMHVPTPASMSRHRWPHVAMHDPGTGGSRW